MRYDSWCTYHHSRHQTGNLKLTFECALLRERNLRPIDVYPAPPHKKMFVDVCASCGEHEMFHFKGRCLLAASRWAPFVVDAEVMGFWRTQL